MEKSEHLNELATALSKAQGSMESAEKDKSNPFFKSEYATLDSVWRAIRKPLSDNGLAIIQTIGPSETSGSILETTLIHSSGQWVRSRMPLLAKGNGPQDLGGAITYMRRYSISALVGVTCDEDDDGNEAQGLKKKPNQEAFYKHPPEETWENEKPITISEAEAIENAILEFDDSLEYRKRLLAFCAKKYGPMSDFSKLPKSGLDSVWAGINRKKAKDTKSAGEVEPPTLEA